MQALFSARDVLWTWVVPIVLALVGLVLTVVLRAPQLLRLRDGFRAALSHDPRVEGSMPPGTSVLLSSAATWGAAAAVSAATAVALGGPGAIAWLWLFGLLIAPLRYAEVLLARSAPPGKAGEDAHGSLATRLANDSAPALRAIGLALVVLVPLAAFAFVGGVHGGAAADAAGQLLPGSETYVGIAVAVVAALAVLPALGRPVATPASAVLGWIALAALGTLFGVAFAAMLQDPARAFGTIPRAFDDVFSGAESVGAFSGAMVGEIAAAALLHVLPPLAATTGADGAIHAAARAPTARGQAAAALFGPLLHVVLATVLACAFVATGAFHRRVEGSRALDEITFWRSGFDTVSQRRETDRTFSGTLRVLDGGVLARPLELATERGMIVDPRYVGEDGQPGDFALRVTDGRITALLEPDGEGTLRQVDLARTSRIRVEGAMLPRGGTLVASAMMRGGGDIASRIALTALLLLAALGAAGWGVAAARSVPRALAIPAAFLPALGLLLAATGVAPWLATVGSIAGAVLGLVAAIGLLAKLRELRA
ncbi:alanine:cation symporter family protein [Sandaracinus amylolyticus]|uniref:Sodium/alanine symporter family protein n=1 Tax=Sandaracinus amylolyticus TaxID=927083 RepID=A0A0F6YKD8_9BACT|nr:alanine:cation symporter family protein [Sandaracinus amylolyticus]AKF08232.1 Sodium/alanine symporter family protein [Sandaracinus amylolyticus]